jgi:hypothetical protein
MGKCVYIIAVELCFIKAVYNIRRSARAIFIPCYLLYNIEVCVHNKYVFVDPKGWNVKYKHVKIVFYKYMSQNRYFKSN